MKAPHVETGLGAPMGGTAAGAFITATFFSVGFSPSSPSLSGQMEGRVFFIGCAVLVAVFSLAFS